MTLLDRVRHILHVINFNDIIGAQFSTSSECNWCTKEKIDSDVRSTKFEHSILVYRGKNEKDILAADQQHPPKRTNWYILRAQNLFLFATVRVNLSK